MDLPKNIDEHRGRLRIRVYVNGKNHQETTPFKATKSGIASAVARRNQLVEELSQAQKTKTKRDRLFIDVADEALKERLRVGRQHSTVAGYEDSIRSFWTPLHDKLIHAIDRDELIDIDNQLKLEPNTRNNHLTALRCVFTYALTRNWIDADPTVVLKNSAGKSKEIDPYTPDEVKALFEQTDAGQFETFFRLAFGTGARTGELLALTWEDWDGEGLWINKSFVRDFLHHRTKTGKPRRVILSPDMTRHLGNLPRPIKGGYIVSGSEKPFTNGKPMTAEFKRAHHVSGVRWRTGPYPWRHTYVSQMLSIGVDPFRVANNVGDRVDTIQTFYAKYLPIENEVKIMHDAWRKLGW